MYKKICQGTQFIEVERYLLESINNAAFSRQVYSNFFIKIKCEIPLNITQQLYNVQIMKTFFDLSGQHPQNETKDHTNNSRTL